MSKPVRRLVTSLPLIAVPAFAADGETGITSVGPALFLFTIAGALLLTLVFRSVANHVVKFAITPSQVSVRRAGACVHGP